MSDRLESHREALQTLANSTGVQFGLPELDRAIRGCRASDLSLIAGPPHGGKTQLAMHLVLHNPEKRVLWFTPDESHGFLMLKLTAIRMGLAQEDVEMMSKNELGMRELTKITDEMGGLKVSGSGDSVDLRKSIDEATRDWGGLPNVIVFDYAEMLEHPMGEAGLGSKMMYFKKVGKETGAAMVIIHQANKMGIRSTDTPSLADMDTAGHKEATLVLWCRRTPTPRQTDVLREKQYPTSEVWVSKNKWQPMRPLDPIVLSIGPGGRLACRHERKT